MPVVVADKLLGIAVQSVGNKCKPLKEWGLGLH